MKTYTLDEVQDKLIGKIGTPERDAFEYELQIDLIEKAVREKLNESKAASGVAQFKHKH